MMSNENEESIDLKDFNGKSNNHKIRDIVLFETNEHFAFMHKTKGEKQFVNINLKQLEEQPQLKNFARISPHILSNPDFCDFYDKNTQDCTFFKVHKFHVTRNGKIKLYAKLWITRGENFKGFRNSKSLMSE